jgi:hypothetical protein
MRRSIWVSTLAGVGLGVQIADEGVRVFASGVMVVRGGCVEWRTRRDRALRVMTGKQPVTSQLLSRPIPCRDPVDAPQLSLQIMCPGGQNSRMNRRYRRAFCRRNAKINSALDCFPHNYGGDHIYNGFSKQKPFQTSMLRLKSVEHYIESRKRSDITRQISKS